MARHGIREVFAMGYNDSETGQPGLEATSLAQA